jgi:hypothetical protein
MELEGTDTASSLQITCDLSSSSDKKEGINLIKPLKKRIS